MIWTRVKKRKVFTCVVATCEVVSGVFFAADQLFRVEELAVGSGSDFIDDGWFEIYEDGAWDVFSGAGFAEEGVESVVASSDCFVTWHLSIRLYTKDRGISNVSGSDLLLEMRCEF